jgi:hypothetical protein
MILNWKKLENRYANAETYEVLDSFEEMFYRLVYRDTVCFPPRFDKAGAVQTGEFDETQSIKPYTHYKHNQYAWARSVAN